MAANACRIALSSAGDEFQASVVAVEEPNHTEIESANLKGFVENALHRDRQIKRLQDRVADCLKSFELSIANLGFAEQSRIFKRHTDHIADRFQQLQFVQFEPDRLNR